MKKTYAIAVLAAGLCAACGSNGANKGLAHTRQAPIAAHSNAAAHTAGSPHTAGTFCNLARQVGVVNLKLSSAGTTADPKKLLAGIDALDGAAPAVIRVDFHRFDRFQHAVLEPGSVDASAELQGSDIETALHHVATFLQTTCKIT